MKFKSLWKWGGVGALSSAALLGVACGVVPEMGGDQPDKLSENFFGAIRHPVEEIREHQLTTNRGYNGTIKDLGSSIDPRTPETAGTPGRSLPEDLAWRMVGVPQGGQEATGGAGSGGQALPAEPQPLTQPGGFLERMEQGSGGQNPSTPSSPRGR